MFCEKCGAQLPEGVTFCSECGATVEAVQQTASGQGAPADYVQSAVSGAVAQSAVAASNFLAEVKKSYKNKTSHTVLSVILSILIVVMGFCATVIFIVRNHTNEDAVDTFVRAIKIEDLKVDINLEEGRKNRTMTEFVWDYAPERMKYYLKAEDVEPILQEKFVSKFVSNKVNDYVQDVFYNTGDGIVEAKEIEKLLLDNRDTIEEDIYYYLSEEDISGIVENLDRDGVFDHTDLSLYREDHSQLFALIKNLLSYWMLGVLIVFALLFTICIFLLQNRKIKGCQYTGINLIIVGILVVIGSVVLGSFIENLDKNIVFGKKLWSTLLNPMKTSGLQIGGITAAAGVVVFLVYIVVKLIHTKIAAKKMM